jgi:hypothetical protein
VLPDDPKKIAEALAEFGLDPEGNTIDAGAVEAAASILETLPITPASLCDPGFGRTLDALSPIVFAASARRRHDEKLDNARHAKQGKYGYPRATMKAIREEIERRGTTPGSSIWKEAIDIMRSRPDVFSFEYADNRGDASGAVHGTKSAADCKGIVCILFDADEQEHEVRMSTIGQYLKKSQ